MEFTRTFKQIKAYAEQRGLPVIPVDAKSVSILKDPAAFYKSLLDGVKSAKNHVAFSALYMGTGPKEQALVKTLHDNLNKNPQLNVNFALDMNRATRVDKTGQSSVTMIEGLLEHKFAKLNLVQANLERSSTFQRFLSRFQRLNELTSTYHSKMMVFDNDVVITGANLSGIYFEERQDRYVKIKNSALLSRYVREFLDEMDKPLDATLGDMINKYNSQFIVKQLTNKDSFDCYLIPLCQLGTHKVRSCDDFIAFLDDILPDQVGIHMSTGYFNPKVEMRLNSVIAPSEQANGFFGGGSLLQHIPRVYTALMNKYLHKNPSCELFLYKRPGWSYHAKGLWVEDLSDVGIYMLGSSNFNWRSSERDFEMQFLLLTTNSKLRQDLKQERVDLLANSIRHDPNKTWYLGPFYSIAANLIKSLL